MWKKKTPEIPVANYPVEYPDGVAVFDGINTYFIKNGKKYKIMSQRAAESWNFNVWHGSDRSLSKTPMAGIIGFRDGTVIKDISDGKIYLVSSNRKRHITTPDFFAKYGVDRSKVIEVSRKEVDFYKDGEPIA